MLHAKSVNHVSAAQKRSRNHRQVVMGSIIANRAGHNDGEVSLLASACQASTQLRMDAFVKELTAQPARRDLAQRLIVNLQRRVDAAQTDKALRDLLLMATGQLAVANSQAFGRLLWRAAAAEKAANAVAAAAEAADAAAELEAAAAAHHQQQQQQQQQQLADHRLQQQQQQQQLTEHRLQLHALKDEQQHKEQQAVAPAMAPAELEAAAAAALVTAALPLTAEELPDDLLAELNEFVDDLLGDNAFDAEQEEAVDDLLGDNAFDAEQEEAVPANAKRERDIAAKSPNLAPHVKARHSAADGAVAPYVAVAPATPPGTPPRDAGAWAAHRAASVAALAAAGQYASTARRTAPGPQALDALRAQLVVFGIAEPDAEAAITELLRAGTLVDLNSVLDTVRAAHKTRTAQAAACRAAAVVEHGQAEQAVVDAEGCHGAALAALAAARAGGGGGGGAAFVEDAERDERTSAAAALAARKARDRSELHLRYVARMADSAVASLGAHAATRQGDPLAMWLGPVLAAARAAHPAGDAFPGSEGYSGELRAGSYLDLLALLVRYGGLTHESMLCDAGSGRGMMLLAAAAMVGCATCGFEIDALRVRLCVRCIGAGWTKLAALVGPGGGLAASTAFMVSHANLEEVATLGGGLRGATHVFAFDTAMPERALTGMSDAINATEAVKIVIGFQNLVAFGLRAVEVPRLATVVAMHGSGERKTARFFRMTPGRRGTAPRGAPHGDGGSFSLDGEGGLLAPITGDHLEQEFWLRRRTRRT